MPYNYDSNACLGRPVELRCHLVLPDQTKPKTLVGIENDLTELFKVEVRRCLK